MQATGSSISGKISKPARSIDHTGERHGRLASRQRPRTERTESAERIAPNAAIAGLARTVDAGDGSIDRTPVTAAQTFASGSVQLAAPPLNVQAGTESGAFDHPTSTPVGFAGNGECSLVVRTQFPDTHSIAPVAAATGWVQPAA